MEGLLEALESEDDPTLLPSSICQVLLSLDLARQLAHALSIRLFGPLPSLATDWQGPPGKGASTRKLEEAILGGDFELERVNETGEGWRKEDFRGWRFEGSGQSLHGAVDEELAKWASEAWTAAFSSYSQVPLPPGGA